MNRNKSAGWETKSNAGALQTLARGLAFLVCMLLPAIAEAQQIITATVTVTNAAGTTNGETITVNGTLRTFTNNVTTNASQVLTGTNIAIATSNLFVSYVTAPQANFAVAKSSTNAVLFKSFPGQALTVTISSTPTNWGTVSYSTNSLTAAWPVIVPASAAGGLAMLTNLVSLLYSTWLDSPYTTNAVHENAPGMANFVGVTNAQTITGPKIFTSVSGTVGSFTNGGWLNGTLTNGVNRGNAFSSPGNSTLSEQFGSGASASAIGALAVGAQALALGFTSAAVGNNAVAAGSTSTAIGVSAAATNANSTAVGNTAIANAANSTAMGASSTASNANSTAIGYNAHTTAANQVMLGDSGSGIDTWVSGNLTVVGNQTNLHAMGTNTFAAGADISFGRYALSSLANGINQDIVVGTNVFVEVSGPSGAFSIEGIAGGRDGKLVIILNQTGQNMTIATEGGATGNDPTAANRIISLSGADRATTGNGAAMLIYSGAASRWILMSFDP